MTANSKVREKQRQKRHIKQLKPFDGREKLTQELHQGTNRRNGTTAALSPR